MFEELILPKFKPEPFKPKQNLLDLTNKFFTEFMEMQWQNDQAEDGHWQNGQGEKGPGKKKRRDDGYTMHYILPDCIVFSDFCQTEKKERSLMGIYGSMEKCLTEGMFTKNLEGIHKDLLYIIKNFDKQPKFQDWRSSGLKDVTKTIQTEEFNMDAMLKRGPKKDEPAIFKVDTAERTITFTLDNSKSGKSQKVMVVFHDNELEEIYVKNGEGEKILTINKREEPKIEHYRYIADINGFLHNVDQVYAIIQEELKPNLEDSE